MIRAEAGARAFLVGAGELTVAVAADVVAAVSVPRPGAPHIATLMGTAAGTSAARRMLQLAVDGDRADVVVDAPVELAVIAPDVVAILSTPGVLQRIGPVVGFADMCGRIVLLLDSGRLMAALRDCGAEVTS